ncbi:RNA polymerase subunit sigma [Jeotgalibacillus alimentarius]|uniref:RNA polymerase subunit sigma n=1 Tax=Jeotgalibacillus alimentarius TaxID=135826 RepID=A0A0C2RTD9_9BACL|nr:sigma-70 family RNA polymerase sigma factor [Jeotgalibacillus alimentarius]KIL53490.1 RNA polymerase subunit sigma [Jeotgalibacillus alimentarius]
MDECIAEVFETEDKAAMIDEIMNRYGQEILQLVYSYVHNKEIAEDLTQDIFVKCYQSLHTYKGHAKLRTWLWRITINHCKDYVKSWYHKKVIITEKEAEFTGVRSDDIEEAVIRNEEDHVLAAAVMNLPVQYREVIYLFYFEELPIKEIGQLIDVKENTVKTRLRRAKELLREGLEE